MKKSWFFNLIKSSKNEKHTKEASETSGVERVSLSVVGDEIHKLAESSREQSEAIKVVLKSIRESVGEIRRASKEVLDRFDAIDSGVASHK